MISKLLSSLSTNCNKDSKETRRHSERQRKEEGLPSNVYGCKYSEKSACPFPMGTASSRCFSLRYSEQPCVRMCC